MFWWLEANFKICSTTIVLAVSVLLWKLWELFNSYDAIVSTKFYLCRTVDILHSDFNWFYPIKILQWKSLYDEYCYGENIHERFNINISLVLFFWNCYCIRNISIVAINKIVDKIHFWFGWFAINPPQICWSFTNEMRTVLTQQQFLSQDAWIVINIFKLLVTYFCNIFPVLIWFCSN